MNKKTLWIKKYLVVIIITAFVSSMVTGVYINAGFNSKLEEQTKLINSIIQSEKEALKSTSLANSVTSPGLKETISSQDNYTITEIVKKVSDSVVGIRLTSTYNTGRFYNYPSTSQSEGSGIIISWDGYILTNYHVVEYADPKYSDYYNSSLTVFLPDGREGEAEFVGGDRIYDLAVIKIDLSNLTVAKLGDSSQLEVGELAVAIGNPLGLKFQGSVTAGIISALNRELETADSTQKFIQTDAAINPGNSGGPLVNSSGEVIGINTIKISITGVEGLGFAIPVNEAKPIIEQLIEYGYVKGRPYLGIGGEEINEFTAKQYGLPEGIYVTEVDASSSAYKGGMRRGDIIVAFGGKEVKTIKDINDIKNDHKPGDVVEVTVIRKDKQIVISVTLGEQK